MKLNFLLFNLVFAILFSSCSSKKKEILSDTLKNNQKNFNYKPIYPLLAGCENATSSSCLENTISNLIVNEANKRKLNLKNDTLNIGIVFKANGELEIIKNDTNNKNLELLTVDILKSIELLAPAYSKRDKKYVKHTNIWYVIVKDNIFINPIEY